MIKVKKLNPLARIPQTATPTDAGADLYSVEDIIIEPLTRQLVHTGISLELPDNHTYIRIAPRSGLAVKHGIDVLAGVVDSGYRGEICVVLFNTDRSEPYAIKQGDRIAQIIVEKCVPPAFEECHILSDSTRSDKGFGSSGTN